MSAPRTLLFLLLLPLSLLLGVHAHAGTTGTIKGVTVDEGGLAIPGVQVTLTSEALIGGAKVLPTDDNGRFQFSLLQPGIYQLTAEHPSFATVRNPGLRVLVGRDVRLTMEMPLAGTGEDIVVIDRGPTTDVASTSRGEVLSKEFLASVPTGRSYPSITKVPRADFEWLPDVTIDVERVSTGEVLSRHEQARFAVAPAVADRVQVVAGVGLDADGRVIIGDGSAAETRYTMDHLWIPDMPLYALNPTGPARVVGATDFMILQRR